MKRKLLVLLTRFPDKGSDVIEFMTGCNFTHASIGLEEDLNTFYTFVTKGFFVEKITRYIKPDRAPFPCQLYEIEVNEKVYNSTKKLLKSFVDNKRELFYSKLGLVLSLLKIPYKRRNFYFCSHFVADVLKRTDAAKLKKDSALYLPGDLRKLPEMKLNFQGNLESMINYLGILPSYT